MCDHEVTQAEYTKYCTEPSKLNNGKGSDYPVYYVSWYHAIVYCNKRSIAENLTPCYSIKDQSGEAQTDPDKWGAVPYSSDSEWNAVICDFNANGYRLPTEAEWEYVARGGKTGINNNQTTYAGSNNIDDVAWYKDNSAVNSTKTHEIKQKNSNSLKIFDMSGNVCEWCWDIFGNINTDTPNTGNSSSNQTFKRIIRGGYYDSDAKNCSISARDSGTPFTTGVATGFRVVKSVVQPNG